MPKPECLQTLPHAAIDPCAVFQVTLNQDHDRLQTLASGAGVDPEVFYAVAALLPMPFLHACNRRWASSKSQAWVEGYCPVCGAWPSFAEVRGIERSRYLRCGHCGGEWQVHCLSCPYCGTTDHKELSSLVPEEQSRSTSAIDVCNRCLGYLKLFTVLQGTRPADVILDDLASVELDVAAAQRGYKRPRIAGYALGVTVAENDA